MRTSGERSVGLARAATLSTPTYSYQPSTEHFQQCAEFLPLRNRGLGTLAVTVLPIPLARRAAATACAGAIDNALFIAGDPHRNGFSTCLRPQWAAAVVTRRGAPEWGEAALTAFFQVL